MPDECLNDIGQMSGDGTTCGPSRPSPLTSGDATSSAEGFPVRTSATPESERASTENEAGSGQSTSGWFARYDPATCSWRTSQRCLTVEWEEFSATWPRAGMTRNGKSFPLRPLVHRTSANGLGYLPTPDGSFASLRGGLTREHDLTVCLARETTGRRTTGKYIGSSLRWHPTLIQEWLRTGGDVNPEWIEQLMGFPIGWTDVTASETPSSPKSPSGSADAS